MRVAEHQRSKPKVKYIILAATILVVGLTAFWVSSLFESSDPNIVICNAENTKKIKVKVFSTALL